jgi:hypothetical protein
MATSSSSVVAPTLGNPPAEKLTRGNHLLWKALVLPALRGARLLGIADGSEPAPPEKIEVEKDDKTTSVPNPAYDNWLVRDQQVLTFLVGGICPEILSQAVGMEHAAEVWSLISSMFTSRSGANVTHLCAALSNTKKINMTADEYVDQMKGFATELAAGGRTIDDDELRDHILNGLDEEYNLVFASVNAMTTCTVSDLQDLLRAFEHRQNMLSSGNPKGFESSANSASRGGGGGRGYYKKNNQGRPRGREEERGRNGGGGRRPHKEDMDEDADVDVVEIHLDSATTSSAKFARKKATPRTPVGGVMRTTTTTTTTTTRKLMLPMVWIPIGIPTPGQPTTSPATLRSS